MANHSNYSPSSAASWMVCNKSILSNLIPQEEGEAAIKGTALHDEIDRFLKKTDGFIGEAIKKGGLSYRAKKLIEAANEVCELDTNEYQSEQRVYFYKESGFGTSDIVAIDRGANVIYITDFKTGMIEVEAKGNKQLLCYAAGVEPLNEQTIYALTIIQMAEFDREPTVDTWIVSAQEVATFKAELVGAIEKFESGNIEEVAGTHCTYCRISMNCRSFTKYMKQAADKLVSEEFNSMNLFVRLTYAKKVEKLAKKIIDEAKQALNDGKECEGFYFVKQKNGTGWSEYAEPELYELYGEKIYEKKLKSYDTLVGELGDEIAYLPEGLAVQKYRDILRIDKAE